MLAMTIASTGWRFFPFTAPPFLMLVDAASVSQQVV
jgi:hypothetical protein